MEKMAQFIYFDQKFDCVSMVVPSSSSDIFPHLYDNTDYWPLDEASLLFL
jgi:hypothetical protein